jgi:hypothetical protein
MRNRVAMYLAIIAGILLLGIGVSGADTWETIRNFVVTFLGDHWALILLFQVLILIASFGGVAVICGGILIGTGRTFIGKLLVGLGTGTGLIGLLLVIAVPSFQQGGIRLALGTSSGIAGIILSILARMIAK